MPDKARLTSEEEAKKLIQGSNPTSLGQIDLVSDKVEQLQESKRLATVYGHKEIPLDNLPSRGLFYPDDTQISISAATVAEVRLFSSMDENDPMSVDEKLTLICDKCLKIQMDGEIVSPRELQEADRFYLIFCIRELTFIKGENKIMLPITFASGDESKVELKSNCFGFYETNPKLMKWYDSVNKCFVIQTKYAGEIIMIPPTIGAVFKIKKWVLEKRDKKAKVDETFIKILPFIIQDWRTLTNQKIDAMQSDSLMWDTFKISAYINWAEKIQFGVKPTLVVTNNGGEEALLDITFPGGIKQLFVVSEEDED